VEIDFSEKITCANLIEHVRKGVGQDVEISKLFLGNLYSNNINF